VRRAEKAVDFLRRKPLFEDRLDGGGVVHETRSFSKQVFEFVDEQQQLVRRN
jgi:hypothetical protein